MSEIKKESNQHETPVGDLAIPNAEMSKKIKRSASAELIDYIEIFVFAVCFVVLIFSFMFRLCTVSGPSMENTLFNGERLVVSKLFYTPRSGDVIVFHQTGTLDEPIVKRVIATEGEAVQITYYQDTMVVTIVDVNGNVRELSEPYMKYEGDQLYVGSNNFTVPDGHLFVLGDNRNNSKDSRHPAIGFVDERRVLGKVILRLSPIDRLGFVA